VRRFGFAWRPRWFAWHLLCLALIVTMVLLGRWQLVVSDEKGFNVRNFGYALQWWAFCVFVAWMWWRVLRDHAGPKTAGEEAQATPAAPAPAESEPVAYRRYVMPKVQADTQDDPELAAYNDYLAHLAERSGDSDAHE
jgi:DNA-binding transcriptional regulator of glucitol operon